MWFCIRLLFFVVIFSSSFASFATPSNVLKDLAQMPYWRTLLHFSVGKSQSDIIDPTFFLASAGGSDPYAELIATLNHLNMPIGNNVNNHAQCRYIARYHWLKQQVPSFFGDAPQINCPLFDSWTDQQQISSVSIVFASGYLGNPASFYGHVLLKLNSSDDSKNILQHQSLNFGAAIPNAENPLVYMAKGLFGGYNAVFSHGLFYKNIQTYGEAELRDLWEYQLQLKPQQVQQLIFHAWELIGREYQYFFLQQNCAYRMAELLELVIGAELISKAQPWAMPITVFHKLANIVQDGNNVVQQIIQHPSRQQRFNLRYAALNKVQRQVVSEIIAAEFFVHVDAYVRLSKEHQSAVLEMLIDYLEFLRINKHPLFTEKAKYQVLQARLQLPSTTTDMKFNYSTAPHQGTLPSMLQLSAVQAKENGGQIRLRATYYDLLTVDSGRAPYSALSMFDLTLRYSDTFQIKRFDLLNIENMNLQSCHLFLATMCSKFEMWRQSPAMKLLIP